MLQHINPFVKCTSLGGQAGYTISRADGFRYLQEKGINGKYKSIVSNYVIDNGIGELYPGKQFLNAVTRERRIKKSSSRKLRALVFTRESVNIRLRKKFDQGMQNLSNKSVYTNKQYVYVCVYICIYMYIYIYMCMCMCMCVCMCICMMCVYDVCVCVYV